ncbi:WXG100 family type VII secretion target [Streptomyces sp. NEAU-sy36]|uniref:WXG100 family type VII secretion target n=1 Tax=unclassified Streptomyces TaxID=2593676 RepID=UPI0015D5B3D5|nr:MULTISPECIES: WXG100 family type VII secretion target [unclassified Streptomyces]QLJ01967.1 WXG100 family type VII secretion target [Streptomyces sp. NEAU-sy36]
MGSPDYNTGGFKDSDDGVFGDPGSDPGSIQDYNSWDWKQIMAAINGMAAGTSSDANVERAKGISDPQSLMDAAGHFLNAQVVLTGIAKSLADQANALAGENGPWKGAAADAFLDMINTFSRQVKATADVLSGGEAGNSVPQQLADNSINLHNAQVKIADIDSWYANQAVKMGVKPMSNGLIPIHEKPELVEMMTSDMRAVLKSLAGEYQVTIDSVHTPPPVTSPTNGPDVPDDIPDLSNPDLTDPGNVPDVNAPDPQQFAAPDVTGTSTPEMPAMDTMDALATPTPYSGGTGVDGDGLGLGGDGLGLDGLPGDTVGNDTLDPSALDQALNPTAFPGGSDLGGAPTFAPTAFPGLSPNPGTDNGTGKTPSFSKLAEDPSTWGGDSAPLKFPGSTDVGAPGGLDAGAGLDDISPAQYPGGLETGLPEGLDSPSMLNDALESSPGSATAGDNAGAGLGGMPMMPGMGGAGGMPQTGTPDPSDSRGLLDNEAEPWLGDPAVGDEVGGHGADAGGDGLALPLDEQHAQAYPGTLGTDEGIGTTGLGTGGMPMMPGMGGAGGMPQTGTPDPSDSRGLLDNEAEPWLGDPAVDDEVGGHGADAGGDGLALPLDEQHAQAYPGTLGTDEGIGTTGLGTGGMPMMPGMGGAGGTPQTGALDPSDSRGLLDNEAEPWLGDPDVEREIGGAGASAGGEGLGLPLDAEAAAPGAEGDGEGAALGPGGVPMMPGMAQGGPAAQAGPDRSDSSGLLEPDAESWTGAPGVSDEVLGGADAGGEGLAGLPLAPEPAQAATPGLPQGVMIGSDGLPITPEPTAATLAPAGEVAAAEAAQPAAAVTGGAVAGQVGPGMPGMMPGAGAAPAGTQQERSDSSGLLAPDTLPWTPDAQTGGERPVVGAREGLGEGALPASLLGAAAGATAAAVAGTTLGAGAEQPGERRRRHRDEDDEAALVVLPTDGGRDPERPAAEAPGDGDGEEPAAPRHLAAVDSYDAELPDDHVALAPASEPDAEDTAAWDSAGASFVPLLWSVPTEDEQEVQAPGYATEDASTWSGGAAAEAAQQADGPRLNTWRPNRSAPAAPGEAVVPAVPLRSFTGDPSELTAELPPQEPVEEPEDEAEAEQPSRGIADLLVQDSDTWGSTASDGSGAVL